MSSALAGRFFTASATWEALLTINASYTNRMIEQDFSSKRSNQSKGNKSVVKTPSSVSMVNVSLKHFLELFFRI